ncbi:hypothetical protein ZYGR_0AG00390 [Zygosaccharomyces rouxii]|uniref:Smr domain-containing protein n=1 Tax=Zygosaccharomyces rouxii TaxID=4956 RepID=A0A1Q3A8Q5_ZYGRO|nr:hypothetical protein ZYGR_0AG00390 [Zygosaccharomyces rouxii]
MDESVALLVEMFPNKPVDDLNLALKSSNGILDDACAMLVSEDSSRENVNPHEQLKSMFPLVNQPTIDKVWNDQNGNFDATVVELLNHHMLLEENDNDSPEPSPKPESKSTADIVQEYTGVTTNVARHFSYRSSFNVVKAIVAILDTYREPPPEKKPPALSLPKRHAGGRVQGPKGAAHSDKLASSSTREPSPSTHNRPPYVFSVESAEAQELEDAIQSNLNLRSIHPKFLHRALEYYRGDLLKTLQLAGLIIEENGTRYTYKDAQEGPNEFVGFTEYKPRGKRRSPKGSNGNSNFSLQDDSYFPIAHSMWSNVLTNTRLDFHGFLCSDAIQVLQKCLEKWWKYELDQRELNNQKLFMSQVANVDPLRVITGRGIHSDNGVSKLKTQVRRFLERNQYKYIEDTAYFIVVGKKVR